MLDLNAMQYIHQTQVAVRLHFVWIGLFTAFVFGNPDRAGRLPEGNAMREERFGSGPGGHIRGGDQYRKHRRGHGGNNLCLPSTWDLKIK